MDDIQILHMDASIIICVKPPGVLSQSGTAKDASMVTLLQSQLGGVVFPVHRLDKMVGGVMVYARTGDAAAALSRQIQQGQMIKEYLAVLTGIPTESEGLLTDLLYHDRKRNKTFVVARKRKGVREARLLYRALDVRDNSTLVHVRLLTGRTHQIRAQFASRGLPLAGDGTYGGGKGLPQLWSMAMTLTSSGDRIRYSALPEQLGPFLDLTLPAPFPAPEELSDDSGRSGLP